MPKETITRHAYNLKYDNGDITCKEFCGFYDGDRKDIKCKHPAIYDWNENVIEKYREQFEKCASNPRHCVMYRESNSKAKNRAK